jgi:hypothetical protein
MYYKPPIKKATRNLLTSRGVSPYLFGIPSFEIDSYIKEIEVPAKDNGFIELSRSRQIRIIKKLLENPYENNLVVIGGEFYANKAQALALLIMRYAIANRGTNKLPYWNYLTGTFKDKIRDDPAFNLRIGKPGLLILDGLTATSTDVKLEKTFDLVQTISAPKILVCCGVDPVSFCRNKLYVKPDCFLYLSETRNIEI